MLIIIGTRDAGTQRRKWDLCNEELLPAASLAKTYTTVAGFMLVLLTVT